MSTIDDILDSALVGAPGDKILLPLMGYPSERDAMFIAVVMAEYFGCNLHVYHIAHSTKDSEKVFLSQVEWLKRKEKEMKINLEIVVKEESKLRTDKAILAEIKALAPKLTVMMSRRKGLLQRLSGSIAERIARKSPYSVLVIRSPLKDWITYGRHIEPRKILVPIGNNSPSEASAVQFAIALANAGRHRDATITLLHVIVVPETVPIIAEDDELIINEEKKFVKEAGRYSTLLMFPMDTRVVVGRDVGRSVKQFVNKEQIDLVVMGVPYLPRKILGLYGTDTAEINKSRCPVVMYFNKDFLVSFRKTKK